MAQVAAHASWVSAFRKSGRYVCQDCDQSRRPEHRGEKNLRVTVDEQGVRAHCHHCGGSFVHQYQFEERRVQQNNVAPMERTFTSADRLNEFQPLTPEGMAYLASRGISAETAQLYGAVSAVRFFRSRRQSPEGKFPAIGFQYTANDRHYATKWRCIPHRNFIADGAAHTLFGPDSIEGQPLILCEGEIDAMSVHTATDIRAKSIPNGSSDTAQQGDKLKFLNNNYDEIKAAAKVILVMDQDKAGSLMGEELARRIGRSKVWRVRLPDGVKDANEVLVQSGPNALKAIIDRADPWPIEGMTRAYDAADKVRNLHRDGMPPGTSTGWNDVDKLVTIKTGMLYIITGIPGHGKSTWVDNLMVNMADKSGWAFAIGSFETPPELGIARLISVRQNVPFASLTGDEVDVQLDWAQEHFHFLTSDGLVTVESLIERTEVAVTRFGVKGMIIDPYNYVRTPGQEMGTEAVNELLSKLKAAAIAMDVAVFLVAHPAKPQGGGEDWVPTGYDISGSANFYNRADFGLTMSRAKGSAELEGDAFLTVWKAKWSHLGKTGRAWLDFNSATERFSQRGTPLHEGGDNPFVW